MTGGHWTGDQGFRHKLSGCFTAGDSAGAGYTAAGSGIAGSITVGSLHKVMKIMARKCSFNRESVFCDLGAGNGRPVLHVAVCGRVLSSHGYELDEDTVHLRYKSMLEKCRQHELIGPMLKQPLPYVVQGDFTKLQQLVCQETGLPVTHMYSFCEGMPQQTVKGIARLVRNTPSLQGVALVMHGTKRLLAKLKALGFPECMKLVDDIVVKMVGSGCVQHAYVFQL